MKDQRTIQRTSVWAIASMSLVACSAEVGAVDVDGRLGQTGQGWASGSGPTRGHEDILRFGVELANTLINDELGLPDYFPTVNEGDACTTTSHALLKGNCSTDVPSDEMTAYYGVSSSVFESHPSLFDLHFLRNRHDAEPFSSRHSCHSARERIIVSTNRGMAFWDEGDREAAFRWFGHASHTVQDSFATSHTSRAGARYETLTDVCTYGLQVPEVCYHQQYDLRDRIWQTTASCTLTSSRPWDCFVPEAQAAAQVSAGYFLVVARHIEAGMTEDLVLALRAFFDGDPTNPYAGYFRCDSLKNDGYEPPGWDPTPMPDAQADAQSNDDAVEIRAEGGSDTWKAPDARAPESGKGGSSGTGAAGSGSEEPEGETSEEPPSDSESTEGRDNCACRMTATRPPARIGIVALLVAAAASVRRRRTRVGLRQQH